MMQKTEILKSKKRHLDYLMSLDLDTNKIVFFKELTKSFGNEIKTLF